MNNTTTLLNDGAELGGNVSVTATTPNAITITESERDRFLSALYTVMYRNFNTFLESQPVVLAVLGVHSQHTKDKGTNNAINNFVNAISSVNAFIATLTQKQICFYELESFLNSIPLADEETE